MFKPFSYSGLALALALSSSGTAMALEITPIDPGSEAGVQALLDSLLLPDGALTGVSASASGFVEFYSGTVQDSQFGTFTNTTGVYGMAGSGVVLSTGRVTQIPGGSTSGGPPPGGAPDPFVIGDTLNSNFMRDASPEQEARLNPITGQPAHRDPAQFDLTFTPAADVDKISLVMAFASDEPPLDKVTLGLDGLSIRLNGDEEVTPSVGTLNSQNENLKGIEGTNFNGVVVSNNLAFFQVDFENLQDGENTISFLIADDESIVDGTGGFEDTAVFLSLLGDYDANNGLSEFTPELPDDLDVEVGEPFTFALTDLDGNPLTDDANVFIDPYIATGYEVKVTDDNDPGIDAVTTPTQFPKSEPYTIKYEDQDGNEQETTALPGETVELPDVREFYIGGLEELMLMDVTDPLLFPLAISPSSDLGADNPWNVSQRAIVEASSDVPEPSVLALLGAGALGTAWFIRRRRQRA